MTNYINNIKKKRKFSIIFIINRKLRKIAIYLKTAI